MEEKRCNFQNRKCQEKKKASIWEGRNGKTNKTQNSSVPWVRDAGEDKGEAWSGSGEEKAVLRKGEESKQRGGDYLEEGGN